MRADGMAAFALKILLYFLALSVDKSELEWGVYWEVPREMQDLLEVSLLVAQFHIVRLMLAEHPSDSTSYVTCNFRHSADCWQTLSICRLHKKIVMKDLQEEDRSVLILITLIHGRQLIVDYDKQYWLILINILMGRELSLDSPYNVISQYDATKYILAIYMRHS